MAVSFWQNRKENRMKTELIKDQITHDKTRLHKSLNVYFNGANNDYPQIIEQLVKSSPTALQCTELYSSFLGGAGFYSDVSGIDLTSDDLFNYTPNDLLQEVANSIAIHQGVFVHVNYNGLFEKEDFKVLPFSTCRVCRKDDSGYYGKIAYSKTGWNLNLKKDKIVYFDVFNPNSEVIKGQVERDGGWQNYKGQVLFFNMQNSLYPISLIDNVYLFVDTEYRIGLFYNSTAKRGFNDNKIIRYRPQEDEHSSNVLQKNLKELMGIQNASSVMTIEDDWDSENQDGNIRIDNLTNTINAEQYAHFEQSSANYIRKAFRNIPPQLIDSVKGKLGNTSSDDLKVAQSIYNTSTAKDREKITRLFKILFDNYKVEINTDWKIKQYKILEDGTTTD